MARKPTVKSGKPRSSSGQVGFCQPPEHTRFQPGQSGNPAGRPKGSRSFKTELRNALAAEVVVQIDGKQQRISKFRLIVERLMSSASKGDFKAAALIVELGQKFDFEPLSATNDQIVLSADDQTILDRYVARTSSKMTKKGTSNG
jgi:hypothetical protein